MQLAMQIGAQALPIELIQQIATNLTTINDLNSFSLTSRAFHAALQPQFVYRKLFLRAYDNPVNENEEYNYKHVYHWRKTVLEKIIKSNPDSIESLKQEIMNGNVVEDIPLPMEVLEGVRQLIFEATSKNFVQLESYAFKSRNLLVSCNLRSPEAQYFMLLQILLTNIALTKHLVWLDTCEYGGAHAYTQALAYGPPERQLFANNYMDEDDIIQIWGTANLFLLHLAKYRSRIAGPESSSWGLKLIFDEICGEERGAPGLWENNLWVEVEPEFPRYWFGFFVGLMEFDLAMVHVRPNIGEVRLQEDQFDGKLTIIEFLAKTPTTLIGTGTDASHPFTIKGSIRPLTTFYSNFKFRRVSFITNSGTEDTCAYEGCLLPNSQTILGGWSVTPDDLSEDRTFPRGPFIMWAVEKEDWEYEKILRNDEGKLGEEDDFLNL